MSEFAVLTAALAVFLLTFWLRRKLPTRSRIVAGTGALIAAIAGLSLALQFSEAEFLQSEPVALAWMGSFAALGVLGIVLLIPALLDLAGLASRRKRR